MTSVCSPLFFSTEEQKSENFCQDCEQFFISDFYTYSLLYEAVLLATEYIYSGYSSKGIIIIIIVVVIIISFSLSFSL